AFTVRRRVRGEHRRGTGGARGRRGLSRHRPAAARPYAGAMSDPERDDRSPRERMLAGDLYNADDPELNAASLRAARLQKRYAALWPDDPEGAAAVLRELLGGVGEGAFLKPPLYVDYGSNLRVGARTFANYGLVALDVVSITIGDDVQIGPNVQLLTPTHPLDPELRRAKWEA